MQRLSIWIATTVTAIVLGFSATTMAFSFNLGPGTPDSRLSATQTTNGADIPTPKLFQVTLGQPPAPASLSVARVKPAQVKPAMRLQNKPPQATTIATSTSVAPAPTPPVSQALTAQPLSGSELYLLRHVHQVATQP